MKTFNIPDVEAKERQDIYDLIDSNSQSPQMIIDYIKDHKMMHFGTTNLSETFNYIILYCYSKNKSKLAEYIFDAFIDEIEFGFLVFKLMDYRVEASDILKYFDLYAYDTTTLTKFARISPNALLIKSINEYRQNDIIEYFELLKDNVFFMKYIKEHYLPTMFTGYQRRIFLQDKAVELIKIVLKEDDEFYKIMLENISNDEEVILKYFDDVIDMFIF